MLILSASSRGKTIHWQQAMKIAEHSWYHMGFAWRFFLTWDSCMHSSFSDSAAGTTMSESRASSYDWYSVKEVLQWQKYRPILDCCSSRFQASRFSKCKLSGKVTECGCRTNIGFLLVYPTQGFSRYSDVEIKARMVRHKLSKLYSHRNLTVLTASELCLRSRARFFRMSPITACATLLISEFT